MSKSKGGTQMEVARMAAAVSDREAVEDGLNATVFRLIDVERERNRLRRQERELRARLATLPREL